VLKQLVAWVGRDAFLEGIQRYFRAHEWTNTTLADLLKKLEETSGRDLASWSQEWLETAGVNTFRALFDTDAEDFFTSFAVAQEAPERWPTLRSHRLAIGLYDRVDDRLLRRERFEIDVAGARTNVPELLGVRRPEVVLLNDDDLTYGKIRLDQASLQAVLSGIADFAESLPRTLCWAAAWDMTRDAEMAARDYIELVLGGIATEVDSSVVAALLRQAASTVLLFVAPEHRWEAEARLADGLERLLRQAPAGSDSQLQFARAFASAAHTDAQLAVVRGLFEGEETLDGLTIDTEMRWHLLRRLVAAGVLGEEAIEAELARDSTATGQQYAAAARCARPDSVAKRAAWASVVERDDLPNALQSAVIGGFAQPGQEQLLRPYVARYFAALTGIWATRTNETAQNIVTGLYPTLLCDEETLAATDAWLATADPVPALRRLVMESRDGVARALRAQERDREVSD
jgi:aminopeptidase N